MNIVVDDDFHEAIRYELLQDVDPSVLKQHETIRHAVFYERTQTGAEFLVVTEDGQLVLYEVSVVGHTIGGKVKGSEHE